MTRPAFPALLVVCALALGGCYRTAGIEAGVDSFATTLGSGFGRSGAPAAAAMNSAAMGGLLGDKIAGLLDEDDRVLAYRAQIDALDSGAAGAPVPWRNPASGRYGNIVPGPAYDQQGMTCRGYSHFVTIGGRLEIGRGTACRVADRPWAAAAG